MLKLSTQIWTTNTELSCAINDKPLNIYQLSGGLYDLETGESTILKDGAWCGFKCKTTPHREFTFKVEDVYVTKEAFDSITEYRVDDSAFIVGFYDEFSDFIAIRTRKIVSDVVFVYSSFNERNNTKWIHDTIHDLGFDVPIVGTIIGEFVKSPTITGTMVTLYTNKRAEEWFTEYLATISVFPFNSMYGSGYAFDISKIYIKQDHDIIKLCLSKRISALPRLSTNVKDFIAQYMD